jgi:hypothetical protein
VLATEFICSLWPNAADVNEKGRESGKWNCCVSDVNIWKGTFDCGTLIAGCVSRRQDDIIEETLRGQLGMPETKAFDLIVIIESPPLSPISRLPTSYGS